MFFRRAGFRQLTVPVVLALVFVTSAAWSAVITTESGMQFTGRVDKIGSLNENPLNPSKKAGEVANKLIVVIDDNLRRTFVSSLAVRAVGEGPSDNLERIRIQQRVASSGRRISTVGPILNVTPFDEWGRRIFTMQGPRRPINVIQAITEITPVYTKVQGLLVKDAYVWDMRIATSSIGRERLSKILERQIDQEDVDARLSVVRLYIQAERYRDAILELNQVMADFPGLAHLKEQLTSFQQQLTRSMLREIEHRRDAGQYRRVDALLRNFPSDEVAGETLLRVRDTLADLEKQQAQYHRVLELMEQHAAELTDEPTRVALQPALNEIRKDLSVHSLNRMAGYLRLADDESMAADQKISLAISGWLLGSAAATENLAVAQSLFLAREQARRYLRATRKHERDECLQRLAELEGGAPSYLAKLIANMKPPLDTQAEPQGNPGLYRLTVTGIAQQPEFNYHVQLPPEYDPYRRYPCIVTLNGAGSSPLQQIDWWAGTYSEKSLIRMGQAARHGYVVIAPEWTKQFQRNYEYSSREHAAVLFSLRDACSRLSIDTDRVFLSGHSMGGDAAWDIGVSHPDLWAGIVPIVAHNKKYIKHYAGNARRLPMYFVGGEKDRGWLHENGSEFDRYLRSSRYNCTVVQFLGRGHEHFQDEIQRIFAWMQLTSHRRDFTPKAEWEVRSMRPWDNFFWWLELNDFPPESMVYPVQWPPSRGTRAIKTRARILENGRVTIRTGARRATVWLSPEMVNFDRRVEVTINGRDVRDEIQPSAKVLLEDVRTRHDRQHPFWAKIDWQGRSRS